jgi:hypothetical protein
MAAFARHTVDCVAIVGVSDHSVLAGGGLGAEGLDNEHSCIVVVPTTRRMNDRNFVEPSPREEE